MNKNKWIGVGGKLEDDETPQECLLREVKEETGLTLTGYRYRGLITFISDEWESELMHLYTATDFEGTLKECDEGELKWIPIEDLESLKLWEGDRKFLPLLVKDTPFFEMRLEYQGDNLKNCYISNEIAKDSSL